ncbi:O-antigen ligase family protein [Neolewinella lacunae]|uniref:O-antigen ligase family protein n=1 Tax=Neolewinella lacunae TaxID=1517758 RepID=A0A923PMR6_9BACT|nr:O-antigen ligase family protein [Neolewinella lacunae]MBC6994144.1 O-antigen ligase family protein [Neolewinella lacunae]MDN3636707.1 O-antigen ligase family protein [Neolewinella lacunae]
MKALLAATFFAMALTHLVDLNIYRYLPILGLILLIVAAGRRIFTVKRSWYWVGGMMVIVGSAIPSVLYGNGQSLLYVVFAVLNFFLYPLYEKIELTEAHLAIIFGGLCVSIIPFGFSNRIDSIYGNPNNYSAVVFSTLYFGMLLFRDRWRLQVLVLLVLGLFLFWGESRSIFGALIIFVLLYFGQRFVFRTTLRSLLVLGFGVACLAYYTLITNDQFKLLETIQQTTYTSKRERGLAHRDELFFYSLELIDEQPQGVGLGMSTEALEDYYGEEISPHNTYLKVLVEGGWVALAGFLVLMLGFFWTSSSPLASAFLFALLIRGFFESSTPFTISLISGMLIIPMFLNENSVGQKLRMVGKAKGSTLTVHPLQ